MEAKDLGRISPTVTKEKWAAHARSKLSRGYVLIVGKERRNANFHHPRKGYEMCPYKIARRLIDEDIVRPAGRKHHLGEVYVLVPDAAPPPPNPVLDDDDEEADAVAPPATELNDLLDRINVEDDPLDDAEDDEDHDTPTG